MRPKSSLFCALLILCSASSVHAASSVKVVSGDEKLNCRFIKFIKTQSGNGKSAALQSALERASGYGANGFYVMNSVGEDAAGKAEVDGQALECKG